MHKMDERYGAKMDDTKSTGLDAPAAMKLKGSETDKVVFEFIRDNPGSTIKEIADSLEMSNGKVDHSVNRLKEKKVVDIQFFRRNRGLVKKVSQLNSETLNFDEVCFPLELLSGALWRDKAYACAVSRSAIIISPEIKPEWNEKCVLVEEVELKKKQDNLIIKMPERFMVFYELPNAEVDVSGYGDELLITVGSTIIPVDVPRG